MHIELPTLLENDKPILYYPLDSWFIKITEVRYRMFDLKRQPSTGSQKQLVKDRFGNWLKNANDWNLSRSSYWGIPLPIWRKDKQEEMLIGSVEEELYNEIEKLFATGFQTKIHTKDLGKLEICPEANYDLVDLHKM